MAVSRVFIGSSNEGKEVAERLAVGLEDMGSIESLVWTQGVFDVGTHVLDGLIKQAAIVDYAILVLSPDDAVESRDVLSQAPRDNVIFELGLFIGALGKDRTYMVHPNGVSLKLPTDLAGITQARYTATRSDGNLRSALRPAVITIGDQIRKTGARRSSNQAAPAAGVVLANRSDQNRDLEVLESNLVAQGWKFRWNHARTTLRVISPRGARSSFKIDPLGAPQREEFDSFIREIRGHGARIDSNLRRQCV